MSGAASLDEMIASLNRLAGGAVEKEVVPALGKAILTEVQRTANAGTSPEGKAWAPKKAGGQALTTAADKIKLAVSGHKITLSIAGPLALHHRGWARGGVQRQVLPISNMPNNVESAARRELEKQRRKLLEG
jgi:hypothetical protein